MLEELKFRIMTDDRGLTVAIYRAAKSIGWMEGSAGKGNALLIDASGPSSLSTERRASKAFARLDIHIADGRRTSCLSEKSLAARSGSIDALERNAKSIGDDQRIG